MEALAVDARLDLAAVVSNIVVRDAEFAGRGLETRGVIAEGVDERIDANLWFAHDRFGKLEPRRMLRMRVQQEQHVRRGRQIELKLVTDAQKHTILPSPRISYRLFWCEV